MVHVDQTVLAVALDWRDLLLSLISAALGWLLRHFSPPKPPESGA